MDVGALFAFLEVHMPEDTAVLDAPSDTAAPPEATEEQVMDLAPDSAEGDQAATETGDGGQATDSGEPDGTEWDGLTAAEIAAKVEERLAAKEKSVEARMGESFRQREENAKQQAQAEADRHNRAQLQQQAEQARRGGLETFIGRGMSSVLKDAYAAGRAEPEQGKVQAVIRAAANQAWGMATSDVLDQFQSSFTPVLQELFGSDFVSRLDPTNAAAIQHAFDRRDLAAVARHYTEAVQHLTGQKVRTKAEAEAAAKAAATTPPPKAASPRQPSPTRAGTPGPGRTNYSTRTEAAALFAEDKITAAQYRQAQSLPW